MYTWLKRLLNNPTCIVCACRGLLAKAMMSSAETAKVCVLLSW